MALAPGTKLGLYEILSPLGAGGMGEVYRGRDTRQGHTVAIKILPSHLSDQPEARDRFGREARAISALNQPNICMVKELEWIEMAQLAVSSILFESLSPKLPYHLQSSFHDSVNESEKVQNDLPATAGLRYRNDRPKPTQLSGYRT